MTDKAEIEALVAVERIECVSHDTGFEEPADPLWRICVDGYCADFEYELAAQNVAAAINKAHATALTALQAQHAAAEARAEKAEGALRHEVTRSQRHLAQSTLDLVAALPDAKGGE